VLEKRRQLAGEPPAKLVPKRIIPGGETEIHVFTIN
jgi:hypothetical protein